MPSKNPYQAPKSKVTRDFSSNDDVKLWMPQAVMMAEKGKSEISILHFFKMKGIDDTHISEATKYAFNKGCKANTKGKLPYTVVGWILIIISVTWMIYTLINYNSFMFILLLPIGVGYGLVKGVYLRDKR